MKRSSAVLAGMFLLVCGCTEDRAFDDLKAYLGSTPLYKSDPPIMWAHLRPVVNRKDFGVPYLLNKSQSSDPHVAITAYLALGELVYQVKRSPSPNGKALVRTIGPEALMTRFDGFSTNGLASPWADWFQTVHRQMIDSLEQDKD